MLKEQLSRTFVTACVSIALLAFCVVGVALADPADSTTFILPHISAEPGQLVSLPMSINTVHDIGAFNIIFEFEQGMLSAEYVTYEGTRSEGLDIFSGAINNYGPDAITGIVAYLAPDYALAGDGPMVNLLLTMHPSIPEGALMPLSFYDEAIGLYNGMADAQSATKIPEFNHGSILFEVDSTFMDMYGDVNLNNVNYEIADLILMFQQLASGIDSYVIEDEQTKNADVNRDRLPWTIADVLLVRDVVHADLPLPTSDAERSIIHLPGDSIWLNGYVGTPTADFYIPVYFSNSLPAGGMSFKINYLASEINLVSHSLVGSRIPAEWDRVSAIERSSGTLFYAMPDTSGTAQDYSLAPGSGLAVTLRFRALNPPENRIRFHFERMQSLGQANGYATLEYPWWSFASFQQIDTDIYMTFVQGDADGSGAIDIDDVVFLIAYIFQGGPAPQVFEMGDFNGDLAIDIDDAIALLTYIFG